MSKSYTRVKSQGLKHNSNTNNNNGNKKMKNYKTYNKKSYQRKYYNSNNSMSNVKIQKMEQLEMPISKKVRFNEIVEVGYTHPAEEYDRTSITTSKLTTEDVIEILHLREQFRMETLEATKKRAMKESQQSSPNMGNLIMPSSPNMHFAVYASTSQGNSSLLTEVPSCTTSVISSPVLTPRAQEEEIISQKQREIEFMIYQRQQMENSYLEALHYQQILQLIKQQQQQNLWRLYSQQPQSLIESDIYLQQANSSYYTNALTNNVSPSMSLWFGQNQSMIPSEYDNIPLMEVM
ncbi:hypothetical protein H8356DRAFT_457490 [Neocallimastix lanati (nom. inval.)]|jgi:hypothetical protein|nr:hypothetical protein H8356DRAFT_457490 [Neocallimastix sp. JGI-2020a]